MKISLIFPTKVSQCLSFVLSIVAAMAVSFFLISFLNSFSQTTLLFRIANAWNLKDSLIYTTYLDFKLTNEEKLAEREKITSTSGVLDANIVTMYSLYLPSIDDTGFAITCVNYSDSLLKDIQYQLSEGSYASKDLGNQLYLPSRYRDLCKVGDTLSGFDYTFLSPDNPSKPPISVTVAGFLDEQPIFRPYVSGTGLDLTSLFSIHSGAKSGDIELEDGIVFGLHDTSGNALPARYTDMFVVRTDGSVKPDILQENLSQVIDSPALLHTGNDMIESHIDASREEIIETLILMLTAVVLSFSILTASTAMELVYRQKEMSILYLCGASWDQCIWSVLFSQILPVVIGFPLGLLLVSASNNWNLFYTLAPKIELPDILLAIVLETLFVSMAVVPFRFLPKFKTPYELFRKD